jgi:hypothetical protein
VWSEGVELHVDFFSAVEARGEEGVELWP